MARNVPFDVRLSHLHCQVTIVILLAVVGSVTQTGDGWILILSSMEKSSGHLKTTSRALSAAELVTVKSLRTDVTLYA